MKSVSQKSIVSLNDGWYKAEAAISTLKFLTDNIYRINIPNNMFSMLSADNTMS
jgi:hypothetical protein